MSQKSLLSEDELRETLARWTVLNSRFAPKPKSSGEAAFILNYCMPSFEEETLSSRINGQKILTFIKCTIKLSDWQTRDDESKSFIFMKVLESDVDSLGNIFTETVGYDIMQYD